MANHTYKIEKKDGEIRAINLPKEYAELKNWIRKMKFGSENITAICNQNTAELEWYGLDAIISVTVVLPSEENSQGYLGACISERIPEEEGSLQLRGNDLADGPYCEEIWHEILGDIVGWLNLNVDFIEN